MPEPEEWHQPGGTISSASPQAAIHTDFGNWPLVRASVVAANTYTPEQIAAMDAHYEHWQKFHQSYTVGSHHDCPY
jgi:hypothetical protein